MATEEKMLAALDKASEMAIAAKSKKDAVDLCEIYKSSVRPLLVVGLPLIERIPRYGKKIADAVRLLMSIADKVCPTVLKASRK